MKKFSSKIIMFISILVASFIGYMNVEAYNSALVASKSTVSPGDTFTVKINMSGIDTSNNNGLGAASYALGFNSSLFEYQSITGSYTNKNTDINPIKMAFIDVTGGENLLVNGTFATVTFKVKSTVSSDATGTFTLTSSGIGDKDANPLTSNNTGTSVSVHVKSTDNTLKSLSVFGASITFDPDTLVYNVSVDATTTTITAEKNDSSATITGAGQKALSYGTKAYGITVTSEAGVAKTYTVNITRPDSRSTNNNLSVLAITGVSFTFSPTTLKYNLTINEENINISATTADSKATLTGDTGKKTLNYGLNTFKVNVKSEKGETKTYQLIVTRVDKRSANNYLSTLSITPGILKFVASTYTYDITVDNTATNATFNATLQDSKASFVTGFGPRTVDLKDGNNTVLIKVKNERGETRTYTINVNRDDGRSTNADLETLTIDNGTIEFDKDVLEYKTNVLYEVEKVNVTASATDSKAKVDITNPTLVVGENIITIKSTAENGAVKVYRITVIRADKNTTLSSDNYLSSLTVENYALDFNKNTLLYTLTIKDEKFLNVKAIPNSEGAVVTVTGADNIKDGSSIIIKVVAETGESREYKINITAKKEVSYRPYIIGGLCLVLVVLIILIIKQKKNGKVDEVIDNDLLTRNTKGINDVYAKQLEPKNNQPENIVVQPTTSNNIINTPQVSDLVIDTTQTPIQPSMPKSPQPIKITDEVTKVCSSCGRRVGSDTTTCPYCLNKF